MTGTFFDSWTKRHAVLATFLAFSAGFLFLILFYLDSTETVTSVNGNTYADWSLSTSDKRGPLSPRPHLWTSCDKQCEWMKLQAHRRKTLKDACAAFNETRPATNSTNLLEWLKLHRHLFRFLWSWDKGKILYCNVPKAACTRWKKVFYILNHANGPFNETMIRNLTDGHYIHDKFHSVLANMSVDDIIYRLRTYKKLIIVRQPFSRSLSAYREKFERNMKGYWTIRHRDNPNMLPRTKKANFSEFLRLTSHTKPGTYNFRGDQHWMPITELCFPCQIDYNYIGKVETMDMDAKFILTQIGAPELQSVVSSEILTGHETNSSEVNTQYKYFHLLSSDRVKSFEKRYQKDFRYFGYDMNTPLHD